jgi:hypothetical protein
MPAHEVDGGSGAGDAIREVTMRIQTSGFLPGMGQSSRWLYRLPILLVVVCGVFQARGQPAAGRDALMVRFQSPTRGEIVTHFADGNLTVDGASDLTSGKWWTGTISAKVSDLDLDNPQLGAFTTEPGGAFSATLSCKGTGDCVTKTGKWTQIKCDAEICNKNIQPNGTQSSLDVWCDSQAACQSFVKSLKDAQAAKG